MGTKIKKKNIIILIQFLKFTYYSIVCSKVADVIVTQTLTELPSKILFTFNSSHYSN